MLPYQGIDSEDMTNAMQESWQACRGHLQLQLVSQQMSHEPRYNNMHLCSATNMPLLGRCSCRQRPRLLFLVSSIYKEHSRLHLCINPTMQLHVLRRYCTLQVHARNHP